MDITFQDYQIDTDLAPEPAEASPPGEAEPE
jgi:hypothetical protein